MSVYRPRVRHFGCFQKFATPFLLDVVLSRPFEKNILASKNSPQVLVSDRGRITPSHAPQLLALATPFRWRPTAGTPRDPPVVTPRHSRSPANRAALSRCWLGTRLGEARATNAVANYREGTWRWRCSAEVARRDFTGPTAVDASRTRGTTTCTINAPRCVRRRVVSASEIPANRKNWVL